MNEGLFEIMTDIDDRYIAEAAEEKKKLPVMRILAAAAALAAVIGLAAVGANYLRPEPDIPEEPLISAGTWRYVDELPNGALGSASYDLVPLTEDEIFKQDTLIFKGTVTSIRNIEVDMGHFMWYRAVVTIKISEVYRGEISEGDTVSILLMCPIDMGGWVEDQGTVSKLRVGMTGIFMPQKKNWSFANGPVCDYEFPDGERFAFLETPEGVTYYKYAYPSLNARNLDDVESYIRLMLLKQLLPWG